MSKVKGFSKFIMRVVLCGAAAIAAMAAVTCLQQQNTGAAVICVLMAVAALVVAFRKKKEKPVPQQRRSEAIVEQPKAVEAPAFTYVNFHAAGVTFANEDGTKRQDLLRQLKNGTVHFRDLSNVEVHLKTYTYTPKKGLPEEAIGIYANGQMLGNVPREKIPAVLAAMDMPGVEVSGVQVVGGNTVNGEKLSYGLSIALRYPNNTNGAA